MNRKFRGKRVDNGEWVYGYYTYNKEYNEAEIHDDLGIGILVDPDTVGQWTGLKDKDGNPIYEGDKLKVRFWHSKSRSPIYREHEVIWGEYCDAEYVNGVECWMIGDNPLSEMEKGETFGHLDFYVTIIHDNKEDK